MNVLGFRRFFYLLRHAAPHSRRDQAQADSSSIRENRESGHRAIGPSVHRDVNRTSADIGQRTQNWATAAAISAAQMECVSDHKQLCNWEQTAPGEERKMKSCPP